MNTCICCGATIPEGRQVCPICEETAAGKVISKPKTNADRIRAMTDEELAELLADETYRIAKPVFDYFGYGIEKQIVYARRLDWLQQPAGGADYE